MRRSRVLLGLVILLVLGIAAAGYGLGAPWVRAAGLVGERLPVQAATLTNSDATAAGAVQVAQRVQPADASEAGSTIKVQPGVASESQVLEEIYQRVNPSVVMVFNLARPKGSVSGTDEVPQGEGSGFVWDTEGRIVTNDHVVRGADKVQVTFADETTVDAEVIGNDPDSDVAVLKIDPNVTKLIPVRQGDMSQVKVGQLAIAIGNPFGFGGTMTHGIVSALGRSIPAITGFSIPEAIQTDAPINPGNSGGPLLNEAGEVIGINSQIQSTTRSNTGVGFAIPINIVQRVVPMLIDKGSYTHAYLGIRGGTYTRAWANALGLPANARGAYVEEVVKGGPADRAGIRSGSEDSQLQLGTDSTGNPVYLQKGGDLITAIDGRPVTRMDDVLIYLEQNTRPGQTVKLTVLRSGNAERSVSVTLGERPRPQIEAQIEE